MICRRNISHALSVFNQRPCCIKRGVVWWLGHVVTNKRNCVTPSIEAFCVSTHVIPATPLVDLTVLTDKKTVSDVIPTYRETKTNPCFCFVISFHTYMVWMCDIIVPLVSMWKFWIPFKAVTQVSKSWQECPAVWCMKKRLAGFWKSWNCLGSRAPQLSRA